MDLFTKTLSGISLMMSFRNLKLINPIIRAATENGYSKPTDIQSLAIPHILAGKDIIACAKKGTGKTGTFVMSILQLLKRVTPDHKDIRILILAPTSEVVIQIEENFTVYSKYMPLSIQSIFDGVPVGGQLAALRNRVDVLVATPERLLNLTSQRNIDLSKIEMLVLDETDKILDKAGISELKKIIMLLSQHKQTLLFSSTMSGSIRRFSETFLNKPVDLIVNELQALNENTLKTVFFVEKKS
ncbi:DEAD/DEAH box helicase [Chryseobacterium indologenes]|uniref:DEAD/DEAH box helicase n=1 Tax=Chryseobacterium indologenes TaxID=253 RepID=UPI001F4CB8D7|nr:DEAD/DEAH box helicase [Chryseobacterium indologenes]